MLKNASSHINALVSLIDVSTQTTNQVLRLLETLHQGIHVQNQLLTESGERSHLLSASLLRTLDSINVELASRANELTADQIGNICLSVATLVDTFNYNY